MGKFSTGFVIGSIAAGAFTLLHAKKSGAQTRKDISNQLNTTINDVTALKDNVEQLNVATKHLQHCLAEYSPILQDIAKTISDFPKQNTPHFNRINRRLEKLNAHIKNGDKL